MSPVDESSENTWATYSFGPTPSPSVFIQWKGTDVCLDFRCDCGYSGHYDGMFAYGLRCYQCGKVWLVPHTVGLLPGEDDGTAIQDTDMPHDPVRQEADRRTATFDDWERRP